MQATPAHSDEDAIFRKIARRIVPFLFVCYVVNFIDRVNIGFAKLQFLQDLKLDDAVFGIAAGMFFVGYVVFEVPSNLLLARIGVRKTMLRIMTLWGLLTVLLMFVQNATGLYVLRFLLGAAEAGFFPGIVLYLTYWFPDSRRGRIMSLFVMAVPLAGIVGGPLSGAIMSHLHDALGLRGWQWLFLIEGAPAVFLAFAVWMFLPDRPANAPWLNQDEKALIARELAAEDHSQHRDFWAALADVKVLGLAIVYFGYSMGLYGVGLWLPQIVKSMGVSNLANGFVVALPYIAATIAMIWWARRSDRTGERIWHVAWPAMLMVASLLVASISRSNLVIFVALSLVQVGALSLQGPFWVLPSTFLGGAAAASGIALINSIGTGGGGFVGPYVLGLMRQMTGGFAAGMAALAIGPILTVTIVLILGRTGSRLQAAKASQA